MLKRIITHPFVFFSITTFVVWWPLALCMFTVKNDALTYYYPVRALISDALHNGELPLWTPFINFGYPLHADMQSGAWSPVVWLFSYLTKFSLAGFHAELLFYCILAGIGFYYLCRQYSYSATTALLFGLAYQCSGFMIDSVQFFACISSACWLPFIFLFYKKMLVDKKATNAMLTAFFLYLLFTGGYPSLFVVTAYLLLAHFIYSFFCHTEKTAFIKTSALPLTIMATTFILLSLPGIISFINHLPYIDRGKTQPLSFVLENSMPPAAMLSFISPFATTAASNWLNTDPLMRNMYIGILPLVFIVYGIVSRQVKIKGDARFFLATAIIMLGMALGSFFFLRQAAYYSLPLMNTFRHPATLRLFTIFFLLLFGAFSFNQWQIKRTDQGEKSLRNIFLIFIAVISLFSIFLLIKNAGQLKSLLIQSKNIKSAFQSLSFTQRYFIQLPFVIGLLLTLFFTLKNKRLLYLSPIVLFIDIFIASQINIPVTVIGATKFNEMEKTIARNPALFPLPSTTASINENTEDSYSTVTGSKLHYTKKIGRNDYYITPGNLASQQKMYESPVKDDVFKKPVVFIDNDSSATISIQQFGANYIQLTATNSQPATLVYLQNNYPGWNALDNKEQLPIETIYETFIAVKLPPGTHEIIFSYKPRYIYTAWYISLLSFVALLIFVFRNIFFKKQQQ